MLGGYGGYGGGLYFDWTMILLIPGVLLSLWAQAQVSRAYSTYSKIGNARGITGRAVAEYIMKGAGLNLPIEPIAGQMTDHYDPGAKVLRLSEGVYDSTSIAALGIAAHEVGHAIQDSKNYAPMRLRGAIIPFASIGGNLGMLLVIIGLAMGQAGSFISRIGIILFAATVAFQLITLPVEFDASNRALKILGNGILQPDELMGARKVLRAAALTYVAAAVSAILSLLRLIFISRRND